MQGWIDGRQATPDELAHQTEKPVITLVPYGEMAAGHAVPGMEELAQLTKRDSGSTHMESRDGFDYLCLSLVDPAADEAEEVHVWIFQSAGALTICYEDEISAVQALRQELSSPSGGRLPAVPAQALLFFLGRLMTEDPAALEDMEEEISDLEDAMLKEEADNPATAISRLRRRLLVLKRHYEALFDMLEDMEENANSFFDEKQLRILRLQTNRADRLSRWVLNLRDYVTQVREAYQNQLDISLNKTMRLFTVITAVFLPLTLIAGWYGMNLQMPEYFWPAAYPAVILVSIIIVVGCLYYFKKKKWF